jgi:hypothetical protein
MEESEKKKKKMQERRRREGVHKPLVSQRRDSTRQSRENYFATKLFLTMEDQHREGDREEGLTVSKPL